MSHDHATKPILHTLLPHRNFLEPFLEFTPLLYARLGVSSPFSFVAEPHIDFAPFYQLFTTSQQAIRTAVLTVNEPFVRLRRHIFPQP